MLAITWLMRKKAADEGLLYVATKAKLEVADHSLVPRPSPAPVFDRLQYAKTDTASDQKLEPEKAWERG